jgi:hypothetical protein
MEEICFSETKVDFQLTIWRYTPIPEDSTLHNHRCENLKSYKLFRSWVEKIMEPAYLSRYNDKATRLDGQVVGDPFPTGAENLVFFTGPGAHSACYLLTTWALSSGISEPGREADHSPPFRDEVSTWKYTSIPQYVFMSLCLINLTFGRLNLG